MEKVYENQCNEDYLRRKEVLTSFFSNKEYNLMTKKQIKNFFNIPKDDTKILDNLLLYHLFFHFLLQPLNFHSHLYFLYY